MWKRLHQRLEILEFPHCKYLPKPASTALDEFEEKWDFQLPVSYREFVLLFGSGEIAEWFNIYAPGYRKPRRKDLGHFIRTFRKLFSERRVRRRWESPDRILRLIQFCDTHGGDYIGWDPEDVRDSAKHEYGIYIMPHSSGWCRPLASSFKEFIQDVCLGDGFEKFWDNEGKARPQVFSPALDTSRR